jgi:hypothetical protein
LEKLKTTKAVDKNIHWFSIHVIGRQIGWKPFSTMPEIKMHDRNVATIVLWFAKLIHKELCGILTL